MMVPLNKAREFLPDFCLGFLLHHSDRHWCVLACGTYAGCPAGACSAPSVCQSIKQIRVRRELAPPTPPVRSRTPRTGINRFVSYANLHLTTTQTRICTCLYAASFWFLHLLLITLTPCIHACNISLPTYIHVKHLLKNVNLKLARTWTYSFSWY